MRQSFSHTHTHTHTRSVVKSLSCVRSMWIDPSRDGRLDTPGAEKQQSSSVLPTQATATPNTYVIPQALHKSSAAPIETKHRKRERIPQILYIIKGIWDSRCVLRAAEKMLLYADDRWLFLHLWQNTLSICCNGEIHSHAVCKGRVVIRNKQRPLQPYCHMETMYLQNAYFSALFLASWPCIFQFIRGFYMFLKI